MSKDASFQMLIDMCEKVGWDKGIAKLEKIILTNENIQISLFAGDYYQQKEAQKLSKIIIQQNISVGKLKQYRKENGF